MLVLRLALCNHCCDGMRQCLEYHSQKRRQDFRRALQNAHNNDCLDSVVRLSKGMDIIQCAVLFITKLEPEQFAKYLTILHELFQHNQAELSHSYLFQHELVPLIVSAVYRLQSSPYKSRFNPCRRVSTWRSVSTTDYHAAWRARRRQP
eukprot:TRINITY_DN11069_c0_g2_i1.p3 TRINITY_DN11069_c0_g2~~TRINITY_DN11069_c0_g2_i1.p3  ORF type:complete len:149 (+),score=12.77 TRINITY_DN11069_c0_g2_i1:1475-1921(+)